MSVGPGADKVLLTGKHKIGSQSHTLSSSSNYPFSADHRYCRSVLPRVPHRARLDLRSSRPPLRTRRHPNPALTISTRLPAPAAQFSTPTEQTYKKGKNILEKVSVAAQTLSFGQTGLGVADRGGPSRSPVGGIRARSTRCVRKARGGAGADALTSRASFFLGSQDNKWN